MQRHAGAIWLPRANEGVFATLFQGNGYGYGPKGVYLPSAMQRQAMWRPQADLLADTVKLGMLAGAYMQQAYGGRYYARSQNLARLLVAAYDRALDGSRRAGRPDNSLHGASSSRAGRRACSGDCNRLWDDDEHIAVQRNWTSLHQHSLRLDRRPACRIDDHWTLLQRTPALPGCGGDRATSRRRRRYRAARARALAPVVMARGRSGISQGFGCMPCKKRSGLSGPMGISSKLIICALPKGSLSSIS